MHRLLGVAATALLLALCTCQWVLFGVTGASLSFETFGAAFRVALSPTSIRRLSSDKGVLLVLVPLILLLRRIVLPLSAVAAAAALCVGTFGVLLDGRFVEYARADPDAPLLFLDVACVSTLVLVNVCLPPRHRLLGNALFLVAQLYAATCALEPTITDNQMTVGGMEGTPFFTMLTFSMIFAAIVAGLLQFQVLYYRWWHTAYNPIAALVAYTAMFVLLVFVNISAACVGLTVYVLLATHSLQPVPGLSLVD